jgi:hypothetical protein
LPKTNCLIEILEEGSLSYARPVCTPGDNDGFMAEC